MLPLLLLSQFVNVKEESANTQTEKWFRKYILSLIGLAKFEKISTFSMADFLYFCENSN